MLVVLGAVLLAGCASGEELTLPAEQHQNLDLISAIEEDQSSSAAQDAAMHAAAEAARQASETEQERAPPDQEPHDTEPEHFRNGNPHETQMDDLFGDMRKQQENEEQQEEMSKDDRARFDLGSSDDAAEEEAGSEELAEAEGDVGESSGRAPEASSSPLLASAGDEIQPGVDEVQSYSTGFVTEEIQVGSENGMLADAAHGLTPKGKQVPKGRVVMFGKSSGVFLDSSDTAWSIYSDADQESAGVCLMTAFNNDVKGLKVCHTQEATGMWASGNVGLTGNLMLAGDDTDIDVQRLQLLETNMNPTGYVLKIGSNGPALAAGVSERSAWMQVTEQKPLLLNPLKGNVGFGTETPGDKMHVAGTMAVDNVFVGHTEPILTPNKLLFNSGTGWEMTDSDWLRVINHKGIESQAGAFFTDKVGVNFNWKATPSDAKLRINDGKVAVTRKFAGDSRGVTMFYDDQLGEGRVYAQDIDKKKWAPLRWEADTIMFNPNGKDPIAIGTRTPKDGYLLHIEGNNKVDGHIYIAKKMKVGGKAHIANMHTPRLIVKDEMGRDGAGKEPADGVKDFVIGEWEMKGETYDLKPGGTNLRLGYYKDYCWAQMFPTGQRGPPLLLNGAGNRVSFGVTHPLSTVPNTGSALLFHVDGNMLVEGNLVVKSEVGGPMTEAESLLDVGLENSAHMLHQLNAQKPKDKAPHFGESDMHNGAVSLSHIAATLTSSLQHHQALLDEHEGLLQQHEARLAQLERR